MEDIILRTKNLKKYFGGLAALDGVDIEFQRGKLTLIIGPNGSGKTTLINTISGIYTPDEGKIYYENVDITYLQPHEKFKLGIVRTFQIPKPFIKLTVLENLLAAARDNPGEHFLYAPLKGIWKYKEEEIYKAAINVLENLNLIKLKDQEAYKLSGGQTKLLEVGRVLMCNAKLVLMDEPAAGISPTLAHDLFGQLKKLVNNLGITIVIVEHRLDIALHYADYAYAMFNGKVISEGNPKEVINDPKVIESYIGK